jgi:hypothetical protein
MMTWTKFWDMRSGGDKKEYFEHLLIEAPQAEAENIFYARYGHDPHNVTCKCCGPDYQVEEYPSLEEATEFHREAYWLPECPIISLEAFLSRKNVQVIRASEINGGDDGSR